MSKRKNRKQSPNLPQDMLERARQQLNEETDGGAEAAEEVVEAAPVVAVPKPTPRPAAAPKAESARPAARPASRRRSNLQPVQSRGERRSDKLDSNYIRTRLANPTRVVTEEELRSAYNYVTKDLRSMGILAVVLILAMVVVEKII